MVTAFVASSAGIRDYLRLGTRPLTPCYRSNRDEVGQVSGGSFTEDKMKSRIFSRLGSLALAGLGLLGCAGPRMVAPKDVAQGSQTLEVADRSSMSGSLVDE